MAGSVFAGAFKIATNSITNVTSITFDRNNADIISQVVGQAVDVHYAGTQNITGTVNFEVVNTDVAVVETNFKPTITGAVEIHLFGDTATYAEITATDGVILTQNLSGSINGIVAGTLTFALNDATIAAAS